MEVFIVTHMGIDSPWPSVVFISLTLEGARHYVDEAVKQDLEPNPYRGIPHEYKSESIDNAEYEWNWNISAKRASYCTVLRISIMKAILSLLLK